MIDWFRVKTVSYDEGVCEEDDDLRLCEFLDEAQLEVSNYQENEGHDCQSQVILPQTPG